jgi:predicted MFS family arabinose efflux permease
VTVGLVALVYGIVRTDAIGWGSPGVLGPIAASVALLAAFVAHEARVAAPLMPLSIFRTGQLRAANLIVLLMGSAQFAMWFFMSLYMQEVLGASALRTGMQFLPITAGVVLGATLAPRLMARVGARTVLTAGLLCAATGLALLSGVQAHHSFAGEVLPGGMIVALGLGLSLVPTTIVGVQDVPGSQSGLASGLLNTSRLVGGAVGLAVLTTLAAARTSSRQDGGADTVDALSSGYGLGFGLGAGLCLLAALVACVLLRSPRVAPQAQPAPEIVG